MKKYTVFRLPCEDDVNFDQHELIGVEYGEDIYDATDRLIEAVREDLFGNPKCVNRSVDVYPPDEVSYDTRYQYEMSGIVSPPITDENAMVIYGIIEADRV